MIKLMRAGKEAIFTVEGSEAHFVVFAPAGSKVAPHRWSNQCPSPARAQMARAHLVAQMIEDGWLLSDPC